MPIYEYACKSCEHRFEELVSRHGTLVACPQCTSGEVSQLLSTFSARTVAAMRRAMRPASGRGLLRRRLRLSPLTFALAPDLAAEWAGCTSCALAASRSLVVAGEGPCRRT